MLLDTNQSWLIFWITNSLSILEYPISSSQRQHAIDSLLSFRSSNGGFGGGPGQLAHLAQTYSSILALISSLTQADEIMIKWTWSCDHQSKLYKWILSLKQTNESFLMQCDGELDLQSSYCALVISTLLNFLTPRPTWGVSDYIVSCLLRFQSIWYGEKREKLFEDVFQRVQVRSLQGPRRYTISRRNIR